MWFFHSAIQAIFDLKRVCPHCRKQQLVRLKDKDRTVPCMRCGKPVPCQLNKSKIS